MILTPEEAATPPIQVAEAKSDCLYFAVDNPAGFPRFLFILDNRNSPWMMYIINPDTGLKSEGPIIGKEKIEKALEQNFSSPHTPPVARKYLRKIICSLAEREEHASRIIS